MKLRRGNVIIYKFNGSWVTAIVRGPTKDGVSLFATHTTHGWFTYSPRDGKLRLHDGDVQKLQLHPDPDRAWADYTAAVLAGHNAQGIVV